MGIQDESSSSYISTSCLYLYPGQKPPILDSQGLGLRYTTPSLELLPPQVGTSSRNLKSEPQAEQGDERTLRDPFQAPVQITQGDLNSRVGEQQIIAGGRFVGKGVEIRVEKFGRRGWRDARGLGERVAKRKYESDIMVVVMALLLRALGSAADYSSSALDSMIQGSISGAQLLSSEHRARFSTYVDFPPPRV